MRTARSAWFIALLACCLATAGCLTPCNPKPEPLFTPLPKLTSAVQALVRWPDAGLPLSDEAMLARVFAEKPELGKAFACVPIKVWHDDRDVVILVCSPDGKAAWYEDFSWTPRVDHEWYGEVPPRAPVFSPIPAH